MSLSDTVPPTPDLPRKSKTKKSRKDKESSPNSPTDIKAGTKKPKKSSRISASDAKEEDAAEPVAKREKMRRKRKREAASDNEGEDADAEDASKKAKKRSKSSGSGDTTSDVSAKKRKNKTGFLDPTEDASLSDQSQKCLVYAFFQFHRPSKWKFNKARQNWLVPERYLPLALGYLAKVQGGVRENLLQSCHAALEPSKVVESPAESAAPIDPTPTESIPLTDAETVKKARAMVLVDLLGSSEVKSS
ncbi:hypothetical protein D9615_000161 [Tricholomella constricta]|uniref:WKF domain-containing protein n=1 Tax=Tricholomella constricta TaxID=117010 RepID=A0A8H5MB07_9AGAR|nr:hypothetical protein D9615_000161 [Tricholomella constricta]